MFVYEAAEERGRGEGKSFTEVTTCNGNRKKEGEKEVYEHTEK